MIQLFTIGRGVVTEIQYEAESFSSALPLATWIDVLSPTAEETTNLETLLRASVPDAEDYEEIEDSARCYIDQNGIHISSLFLDSVDGQYETRSVACILQPERLITIREEKIAEFRLFRMRAKRGQIDCATPSVLLISLMEQKVENLADILESLHRQLEGISKPILSEEITNPESLVSELAMAENSNGKARLCLMDTQRDISFLQRHIKVDPALNDTCREMAKDIDTLMSHTTFLFDKINFLMDFMQGFIGIQQNKIIKIFSIAAVVFLPPTLVASIYGMNFSVMPELTWYLGYPLALVLMVIAGIAPYWYFKRKGWL
jgi:magnesium transporter